MPKRLVKVLEAASAGLLGLLAVTASAELVFWLLWRRSFASLLEIQALLMVWFGMLAAAYCLAEGLHLAVDVVARRLGPRWRRIAAPIPPLSVAAFGCLLAVYGWQLVTAIDNTLPGTGWSAALGYQPVAFAGLLIAAIGFWQLRAAPAGPDLPGSPNA